MASTENSSKKIKVGICQMTVTEDKFKNIETAEKAIKEASENSCDIAILPEMWNCPYSNDSFPIYAEVIDYTSPSVKMMHELSQKHNINLIGGSIPERDSDKLYNTCCIFDRNGNLIDKHRKVHLFDINIPGKISFKESDTLTPGEKLTVIDTDVARLGMGICYDIRFPEMAAAYAKNQVQILIYPGAFNMTTGPLHWELLQRARAADNQLFVITCSPARNPNSSYQAWGHSSVVDPFANIIATCEHDAINLYAELDLDQIRIRRENMPLEKQKRKELYYIN